MQSRYSASLLRHSLNLLLANNRFFRKEAGYLPGTFIHRRSAIPLLLRLSIAVLAAGVPGIDDAGRFFRKDRLDLAAPELVEPSVAALGGSSD